MKIKIKRDSTQWSAEDLADGPRTFTITKVEEKPDNGHKQPYEIHLKEGEGRVWRPPGSVLDVLVGCWGDEANEWKGRKVTLYADMSVKFGKESPGGIRISHLSHIDQRRIVQARAAQGKTKPVTVNPIQEQAPRPATITQAQWEYLMSKSEGDFGATLIWASQQLERTLNDPREITADEAGKLKIAIDKLNAPAAEEPTS